MSQEPKKSDSLDFGGYHAKVDKPPGKPPTGGSAVKKPPSSEQKTKN
jgi:cysteine desulfurase